MYPSIRDGDVITVSPVRNYNPAPGDIAAFRHPVNGNLVVHRLRSFRDNRFLGAGDNTDSPDGWIPAGELLGIVTCIERNGRAVAIRSRHQHPFRALLPSIFSIYVLPGGNAIRRSIVQAGQSPVLKKIFRPLIGPLIRAGRGPALEFIVHHESPADDPCRGEERIGIDLHIMKWHTVRMEFSRCCDETGVSRWWFTGSGTHPSFSGMDLESGVFLYAARLFTEAGVTSLWTSIPADLPGLLDFCREVGFSNDPSLTSGPLPPGSMTGDRIILRYDMRNKA
jgi:hypothetical protein